MNFIVKQVLATKKKRIPLFPLISYLLIQTYGKTLLRRIMNRYLKQKGQTYSMKQRQFRPSSIFES